MTSWKDGNSGFHKVGKWQKGLTFASDYATFVLTLGNGQGIENIFDKSKDASALIKVGSGYAIAANYYMFYSDITGLEK